MKIKTKQNLSLAVLQTIGVARSSGGVITQATIDLLVAIDDGLITDDEAIQEIIKQEGLKKNAAKGR